MERLQLKKLFIYLLVGSVAVSAAVGIFVVLFGSFGEFETRVLLTTVTITCTSILGLACGVFLETGRGKSLPVAGIASAIVAALIWIALIWEILPDNFYPVRAALTATVLAVSSSHLSLISVARLDDRFRWAVYLLHGAVWLLAAILVWIIWFDIDEQSNTLPKAIGVLSILIAALTIVIPVFHRLSDRTAGGGVEEIDREIARLKERIAELEKRKNTSSTNTSDKLDSAAGTNDRIR